MQAHPEIFPELHELVRANYHLEATFGTIHLYRRGDDSTGTARWLRGATRRLARKPDQFHAAPNRWDRTHDLRSPVTQLRGFQRTAVVAFVALWACAYLSWPLGYDHGQLLYAGDVIRDGGMPYRDAWDQKGPAALYLFAAISAVFGPSQWGLRAFDLLLLLAGAWGVHHLVRRGSGSTAAHWSVTLFLLAYASLGYQNTAQPDGWVAALLVAAACLLIFRGKASPLRVSLGVGALVGIAALIKPFYGLFLALPVVAAVAEQPVRWRQAAMATAAALLGFATPILVVAAWFAIHGAFADLLQVNVFYTSQVYSKLGQVGGLGRRLGALERFLARTPAVALALPAALAGCRVWWDSDRRAALLVSAWFLLSVFGAVLAGQFYPYYWLPVLPPLAVLAGVGFGASLGHPGAEPGARGYRWMATGWCALILFLVAREPVRAVGRWAALVSHAWSPEHYYGGFDDLGPVKPLENMMAAVYLRERTGDTDRVGIWGANALILHLAGRRSPGRFSYSMPLMLGEGTGFRAGYRAEFLDSVRRAPPVYFVVNRRAGRWEGDLVTVPGLFPELRELLLSGYQLETTIGELAIYRQLSSERGSDP